MRNYDLVAIGGGAGGLSAVRTAQWAGKKAALITDGPPGGDCTFTGCVPSKALISAAGQGLTFSDAMARVQHSIADIAEAESIDALRKTGIDVFEGRGTLDGPNQVRVGSEIVPAKKIVLATGGAPFVPPIPGLEAVPFLTNETVFDLRIAPTSLAILGGGAIGCELAQAMARLGVKVTLFEALDRLLAREEPEASKVVGAALTASGVDVRVGQRVERVSQAADGSVVLTTADNEATSVARLLVAVGREPHTTGLALEAAGVDLDDRGYIAVDEHLRTSAAGIYAVGDVTGELPFTHAADEMGRLAAGHALGKGLRGPFRTSWIPWCTFTDPEVARIGVTEAEAVAMGGRVAELPMAEMNRAIVDGRTEGYLKLIAGPKRLTRRLGGGEIIGATIVAPRAGEMINELALAMRTKMFTARLAMTVHAYPTWSIAIQKAAAQFFYEIEGRSARKARK
ncbi:MAG: FAD-dependent oxidoreductase [Acidimicrobiales bacterium]|nr:FAD-dependent oxidoreductase [Acidimicrobiales bacterium]